MKNLFNFKKEIKRIESKREFNSRKGQYEDVDKEVVETKYNIPKIVIFSILGLTLLTLFFSSFSIIETGEVGVKYRLGKITNSKMHDGLNFVNPITEYVVKVNVKVQKSEETVESSTKDMQIVNTTVAVNYRVEIDKVNELYKKVGSKYQDTILQPAIRESIKTAIAKYNAEEITTKRNEVSNECLKAIQGKVEKYGILVEDFNLTNISFSVEYTKAIEEKQVAEQKLEKARLEAEQKVVEAEATRKANELLSQTITEKTLTEKFLEKWNGELPKVTSGNGIFNINDFIK